MEYNAIVIGGSAGSFQIVLRLLESFRPDLPVPVLLCLHRLKQVRTGFEETLNYNASLPVREPMDKEDVRPGKVYLAPANYHMLVEREYHFALSTDHPVLHSRPSIDMTFGSAADVYQQGLLALLLSGANQDGSAGVETVKMNGGTVIIQDPEDCEIATMCESALRRIEPDHLLNVSKIIEFISLL